MADTTTCADADMAHVAACPACTDRLARQRVARLAPDLRDALFAVSNRPPRGHVKGLRAVPVDWTRRGAVAG